MEKETVFLAGKFTGVDQDDFAKAQKVLEQEGYLVCNPALLPMDGFSQEQQLRVSKAMIKECETVCLLPNFWRDEGAGQIYERAHSTGKEIIVYEVWEYERSHYHKMPFLCWAYAKSIGKSITRSIRCTIGCIRNKGKCHMCVCNVGEYERIRFIKTIYERKRRSANGE